MPKSIRGETANAQVVSALAPVLILPADARARVLLAPAHAGVYLLAIMSSDGQHVRYHHAHHYLGWAENIQARLFAHLTGRGARFTQVLIEQGYELRLVRTWPGGRDVERRLKNEHNGPRLCPFCRYDLAPQHQQPAAATEVSDTIFEGDSLWDS